MKLKRKFISTTYFVKKCLKLDFFKQSPMCLFLILFQTAMVSCSRFIWITNTTGGFELRIFCIQSRYSEILSLKVFNALQSVKKTMMLGQLFKYSLTRFHLNSYKSYFKFILMLAGDINQNR